MAPRGSRQTAKPKPKPKPTPVEQPTPVEETSIFDEGIVDSVLEQETSVQDEVESEPTPVEQPEPKITKEVLRAFNNLSGEDLVELMSMKGITQEAIIEAEVVAQTVLDEKKRAAGIVLIKDEKLLKASQLHSDKAVYTVYNKNTKTRTEVGGKFASAEARNPDYFIRFKHYEAKDYEAEEIQKRNAQ